MNCTYLKCWLSHSLRAGSFCCTLGQFLLTAYLSVLTSPLGQNRLLTQVRDTEFSSFPSFLSRGWGRGERMLKIYEKKAQETKSPHANWGDPNTNFWKFISHYTFSRCQTLIQVFEISKKKILFWNIILSWYSIYFIYIVHMGWGLSHGIVNKKNNNMNVIIYNYY